MAGTICPLAPNFEKVEAPPIRAHGDLGIVMSTLREFKCEICGIMTENPIHWFVIECGDLKLSVLKWNLEAASTPAARHFCGEAHAQVFISRWFDSVCVPPKR
jgi:hypothetical protein